MSALKAFSPSGYVGKEARIYRIVTNQLEVVFETRIKNVERVEL